MIHSLDSLDLAREIEKQASKRGITMRVLVEINIAGEQSKSGIPIEDTEAFLESLRPFEHICVCGLMTVPPKTDDQNKNLQFFQKIYQKFIDIRAKIEDNKNWIGLSDWTVLSAGMSGDYLQACACGANLVRVGSAVFGARIYPEHTKHEKE